MKINNLAKQNTLRSIIRCMADKDIAIAVTSIKEAEYRDFIGACDMAKQNRTDRFQCILDPTVEKYSLREFINVYEEETNCFVIVMRNFEFENECPRAFEFVRLRCLILSDINGSKIHNAASMFYGASFGKLVLPKKMAPTRIDNIFHDAHIDELVTAEGLHNKYDGTCVLDGSRLVYANRAFCGAIISSRIWIRRLNRLTDASEMFRDMYDGQIKMSGELEYEVSMTHMLYNLGFLVCVDMQFLRSKVPNKELDEMKKLSQKPGSISYKNTLG